MWFFLGEKGEAWCTGAGALQGRRLPARQRGAEGHYTFFNTPQPKYFILVITYPFGSGHLTPTPEFPATAEGARPPANVRSKPLLL